MHPTPFTGYAKKGSVYSAISLSALSAFAAIEFVGVCLRCMLSVSASLALQFAAFLHDDDHAPPTPSEPRPRSTLGPTLGFGFGFHSSFSLEIFHIKNNKKSCMLMFRLVYCRIEKKLKNNFCIWHFSMEANFASRKRERENKS